VLTIILPIPDKALHPNSRVHWARKMKAVKQARLWAGAASTLEIIDCFGRPPQPPRWKSASIRATFYVRDKRGLLADQDGRISSLKAYTDGIADAGVIENDRGLTWASPPIEHRIDRDRPRVEIQIEEIK
jgi:hypothetical protein